MIAPLRRRFAIARVCVFADRGLISAETAGRARGTLRRSNKAGAHVAWAARPGLASVAPVQKAKKEKKGRPLRTGLRSPGEIASKAGRRRFVLYNAALRQRRQASRPPKAATSPGSPAPAMGPGTVEMLPPYPEVPPPMPVNSA